MSTGGIGGGGSFSAIYVYDNRIQTDYSTAASFDGVTTLYTVPANKVAFITTYGYRVTGSGSQNASVQMSGTFYGTCGYSTANDHIDYRATVPSNDYSHAPLFFGDGAFMNSSPSVSHVSATPSQANDTWAIAFAGATLIANTSGFDPDNQLVTRVLIFEYST